MWQGFTIYNEGITLIRGNENSYTKYMYKNFIINNYGKL